MLQKKMSTVIFEAGGLCDGESSPRDGLVGGNPAGETEKYDSKSPVKV